MKYENVNLKNFKTLRDTAKPIPAEALDKNRPVWIFGAGDFGRSLSLSLSAHSEINVLGFVETDPKSSSILGLPIIDWPTLASKDSKAQVALGIFNRAMPMDKLVDLHHSFGFSSMIMPWESYDMLSQAMGWRYWLSKREFILSNMDRIEKVASLLSDQESRDSLLRITAFRLGHDLSYASYQSDEQQYFNSLTLAKFNGSGITYIDCGAYNGDTYIDLANHPQINIKRAFLFEPDPQNFTNLVENTKGRKHDTFCLPMGVGEQYKMMNFTSGMGESGAVQSSGNTSIAIVSLDEIFDNSQIDFIKIDVEGGEASIFRGAKKVIERSRPVIAASLYHNPQDIWELPEILFEICEDYHFYIRQHYFNTFDSVLYAVPK